MSTGIEARIAAGHAGHGGCGGRRAPPAIGRTSRRAGAGRAGVPVASRAALALSLVSSLALAACAAYGPGALGPGQTEADAVGRMGEPTGRYVLDDGSTRLEFARGPYGRHTYMVDVDPDGRILAVRQVLGERSFLTIAPGLGRAELLRRIGRPAQTMRIARQNLDIYSYRYPTNECQWFQVSIDLGSDAVRDTGYGIDPLCDVGDTPSGAAR